MSKMEILEKDESRKVGVARVDGGAVVAKTGVTLWSDARRRFSKNKLAMLGLLIVVCVILVAATAPVIAPYDPVKIDTANLDKTSLQPPSLRHPMGTDIFGRDIFSRIIWGSRVSLEVGIVAVGIMIILGLVFGAVAGYYGTFLDAIVMRLADIFFAFPYVLGAILLITIMGRGLRNTFIAIGILGWPTIARIFRSSILSVKETDYVEAARALGASDLRIIIKHILPNSIAPIIVYGTMAVGGAIITEAALSFLGLGVQPPKPAWGYMLADSRSYFATAPWLMWFPGLAIVITVLGFMLLGDGLRDAIDPRMKAD